ncbi:hypothetical protein DSO57_1005401 [Entomophthora muscae]|uniref:Uncharacterized protein n=1 Tax=Entomophthora muscae TaxID=34485 RepID=A0ACC2RYZ7_9FUNG|nr:hypothetical protein DSO57_1005401 [Entomophthora muscae]
MVLTIGVLSPSLTPYTDAFIIPVCFTPSKCNSPIITSLPLKEDITDVPAIPKVIEISSRPQVAPLFLGTLSCEQIQNAALELARGHFLIAGSPPRVAIDDATPELLLMLVDDEYVCQHRLDAEIHTPHSGPSSAGIKLALVPAQQADCYFQK